MAASARLAKGALRIERRVFAARLRFQQLRGVGAVQERQHRDFFAGDHRQRQQDRARRGKAAGGGRAGQAFAQPAQRRSRPPPAPPARRPRRWARSPAPP